MSSSHSWGPLAKVYDPITVGNIDGVGDDIHDNGIVRALNSVHRPNKAVVGDRKCTLFIGRLNLKTTEETLRRYLRRFGKIVRLRLVKDLVTGFSKRYAFVEYSSQDEAEYAHRNAHDITIDDTKILVEYEFGRNMPGWIPRRFGGGFGGKKESGQLRFGCRLRPFKKPFILMPQFSKEEDSNKKYRSRNEYSRRYHDRKDDRRDHRRRRHESSRRSRDERADHR